MRDVSVCLSTLASPEWKCQALSNPRSPLSLTGMRFLMSLFQALGWWKGTSSEKIAVEGGETWTGARALVRLSSFCQTCVFLTPKLWVASLGSSWRLNDPGAWEWSASRKYAMCKRHYSNFGRAGARLWLRRQTRAASPVFVCLVLRTMAVDKWRVSGHCPASGPCAPCVSLICSRGMLMMFAWQCDMWAITDSSAKDVQPFFETKDN